MDIETSFSSLLDALLNCTFSGRLFLKDLQLNPYFGHSSEESKYTFKPEFKDIKVSGVAGDLFKQKLIELLDQTIKGVRREISAYHETIHKKRYVVDHQIKLNEVLMAISLKHYQIALSNPDEIEYMGRTQYHDFEAKHTKMYINHLVTQTLTPLKLVLNIESEELISEKQVRTSQRHEAPAESISDDKTHKELILPDQTIQNLYTYLIKKVLKTGTTLECFKQCFSSQMLTKSPINYEYRKRLFMIETLRLIFELPAVRQGYKFAKPTYVKANFNLPNYDQIKDKKNFKYSAFRKEIADILAEN